MSVEDDNKNQNTNGKPDFVPVSLLEDLDIVIENLNFIQKNLHQLQRRAQDSNEFSLEYYLEMAVQISEQRLRDAKTQKNWLSGE